MIHYLRSKSKPIFFGVSLLLVAFLLFEILHYGGLDWKMDSYAWMQGFAGDVITSMEMEQYTSVDPIQELDYASSLDPGQVDLLQAEMDKREAFLNSLYTIRQDLSVMNQELLTHAAYTDRFLDTWSRYAGRMQTLEDYAPFSSNFLYHIGRHNFEAEQAFVDGVQAADASFQEIQGDVYNQIATNLLASLYSLAIILILSFNISLLEGRRTSMFKYIPASYSRQVISYFGPILLAYFLPYILVVATGSLQSFTPWNPFLYLDIEKNIGQFREFIFLKLQPLDFLSGYHILTYLLAWVLALEGVNLVWTRWQAQRYNL